MGEIATWGYVNSQCSTSGSPANLCPTYKEIEATGKVHINSTYSENELVEEKHINVPIFDYLYFTYVKYQGNEVISQLETLKEYMIFGIKRSGCNSIDLLNNDSNIRWSTLGSDDELYFKFDCSSNSFDFNIDFPYYFNIKIGGDVDGINLLVIDDTIYFENNRDASDYTDWVFMCRGEDSYITNGKFYWTIYATEDY